MLSDEVLAHYIQQWGEPAGEQMFRRSDFAVMVYDWDPRPDGEEVHIYATVGASAWPLPHHPHSHRLEVFIGLLPPQHEVRHLLADVANYCVEIQEAIGADHTVTYSNDTLWPGTAMNAVVLRESEDLVPMLETEEGLHIEFFHLLPLYPSEMKFKQEHSLDALREHWWRHQVAYWDPTRSPEPT